MKNIEFEPIKPNLNDRRSEPQIKRPKPQIKRPEPNVSRDK